MPLVPWSCARADATPISLTVANTVILHPADDSVDSNSIVLVGTGTINSFGPAPAPITKNIHFLPQGGSIVLTNSQALNLLGKKNRSISNEAFGTYITDGGGYWTEFYYADVGTYFSTADIGNIITHNEEYDSRIYELEERLLRVEAQLKELMYARTT
jgi:hypothetical protein